MPIVIIFPFYRATCIQALISHLKVRAGSVAFGLRAVAQIIELMIGIMPRHSLEWEQKNGPELIGELGFLFSENVDKKRPKSSALYVLDMPHSLKLAQKKYEFPVQPEWKQCDDQSRLMNGLYLLTLG